MLPGLAQRKFPSLGQKQKPWVRWESTSVFARRSGGDPLKPEFNGVETDPSVSMGVNVMANASGLLSRERQRGHNYHMDSKSRVAIRVP